MILDLPYSEVCQLMVLAYTTNLLDGERTNSKVIQACPKLTGVPARPAVPPLFTEYKAMMYKY